MWRAGTAKTSMTEYVILVALLMSIGAMGTDLMLPALDVIGRELGAAHPNDGHYIVTTFFLGMAVGQLFVGPLSDSLGRKPVIYAGYAVFVLGCLMSMTTDSWTMLLLSRFLQGLGAAAPRIVTVALVRDEYAGAAMARILSMVMAVFIVVPIAAPALGQGLIYLAGWRATFVALAAMAVVVSLWFWARQPETLPRSGRRAFRLGPIWLGIVEILHSRSALGYTIATGLAYGMLVGYLGSAKQIFQDVFGIGDLFAAYFALAAAAVGVASLANAKLVARFGMRRLPWTALVGLTVVSFGFLATLSASAGVPSLGMFLAWQLSAFFCIGVIFGNLNALALEQLGHMAGLGAAFVGSIATFISLPLAAVIGGAFDGTVFPLMIGFAVLGLAACGVFIWTNRGASAEADG